MSRPDTDDFKSLFLADTPMMDLRAPLEFVKGAFPDTVSLPLMTDQERAKVGTCYKKFGQDAAITLGHQLVRGDIKEARMAKWLAFAKANPEGYLYCWRGGLRSQTVQQWLKEAGCDYPRIKGGYKAMRRYLIDSMEMHVDQSHFIVLAGETGSGKTEILRHIANSIDLEGLANHRGSSFGKRPDGQPAQVGFENALAIALLRFHQQFNNTGLVLEDESKLIGRNALPDQLRQRMASAQLVVVNASLDERVEHSFKNYILLKLHEWQVAFGCELDGDEKSEQAFSAFADDLRDSLTKVQRRLGGVRYQALTKQMEFALVQHQQGDDSQHRHWIKSLLEDYYDPMYHWQLSKKQGKIIFQGSTNEVQEFLQHTQNYS